MTLTIAIPGARGRLGRCVALAALDAGHTVIAITRDGMIPDELAGAQARAADALDRDQLVAATAGADVVINTLNPAYTDWARMCMPMARNIIAACKAHGAFHLFAGNVYNYGSGMPEILTPETPQHPDTKKGVIRREMEGLFRDAAESGAVDTTILRAGDFFGGTGTGSWFDMVMTPKLGRGRFTYPGRADIAHGWAYLPDLASAFVRLAEQHGSLKGFNTFTFAGHSLTGQEMQSLAEEAVGRKLRRGTVPWLLLRGGGLVVPMLREVCEMSYLWFTPHALDGRALESVVGALPQTPAGQAVSSAIGDLPRANLAA